MANTFGNPIRLDTSGSTNLAQAFPVTVETATLEVTTNGGTATIEDTGGNVLLELTNPNANSTVTADLRRAVVLSAAGSTTSGWKLTALPSGAVLSLYWR